MQQTNVELEVMEIVNRNLQAIWDADTAAYKETCAPDVSFFEWYITTQRIDGIDFHLREILVHAEALGGGSDARTEHEILQPRVQVFGDTAIVTYTLLVRSVSGGAVRRTQQNETRVLHRFDDGWKLVHCHKSPCWRAPHDPQVR
ncbi:MAG: nuclear transport factor 2 family protein [Anaerolineae bacterium]|nr:nuclear transport factor 2 family protein [Anaerolineae bacterium]MCB9142932.1 nuclear transport factor 2 family protein [Anaerolineales bacterium]HRX02888.1 nuclear transport factor 2 family protein [Anaerolineae bacterium]